MACRYRTGKLLFTLAQRLRKHTARLGAFEAWNKCLSHVLALARAHVESVMFERFQDAVDACPDADCRKSLQVGLAWGSTIMPLAHAETLGVMGNVGYAQPP